MIRSFIVGFILLLILTITILLGLSIYSDAKDFGSYGWSLLGLDVFQYEQMKPNGHMLHFGLGIVLLSLFGGVLNALLNFLLNRKGERVHE